MALQLTTTTTHGLSANHWQITEVHNFIHLLKAVVMIKLFKDSAAAAAGKDAISLITYTWTGADYPFAGGSENTLALSQTKIAALLAFSGALVVADAPLA